MEIFVTDTWMKHVVQHAKFLANEHVSRLNWFIFISRKIFYNQFIGIPIKNKINRMSKSLIIAQVSDVFWQAFCMIYEW